MKVLKYFLVKFFEYYHKEEGFMSDQVVLPLQTGIPASDSRTSGKSHVELAPPRPGTGQTYYHENPNKHAIYPAHGYPYGPILGTFTYGKMPTWAYPLINQTLEVGNG